jgi:hypothetical protein
LRVPPGASSRNHFLTPADLKRSKNPRKENSQDAKPRAPNSVPSLPSPAGALAGLSEVGSGSGDIVRPVAKCLNYMGVCGLARFITRGFCKCKNKSRLLDWCRRVPRPRPRPRPLPRTVRPGWCSPLCYAWASRAPTSLRPCPCCLSPLPTPLPPPAPVQVQAARSSFSIGLRRRYYPP